MRDTDSRTKLIYIAGTNYSGTTMLSAVLGSHPDVESLGQVFEIEEYVRYNRRCMCGETVLDCPFWSEVSSRLGLKGTGFFVDRPAPSEFRYHGPVTGRLGLVLPRRPADVAAYRRYNLELFRVASEVSGRRVLVDSSKTPHRLEWLVRSGIGLEIDLRVIQMTRNGLGVLDSYRKRGYRPERAAAAWLWRNRELERVIKEHIGERARLLKYEDLCRCPEDEVKDVCDFAGLHFTYKMLDFRSRVQHQVGGNPMRFGTTREMSLDENWKRDVGRLERLTFQAIAGRMQEKLGY